VEEGAIGISLFPPFESERILQMFVFAALDLGFFLLGRERSMFIFLSREVFPFFLFHWALP